MRLNAAFFFIFLHLVLMEPPGSRMARFILITSADNIFSSQCTGSMVNLDQNIRDRPNFGFDTVFGVPSVSDKTGKNNFQFSEIRN